MSASTPEGTLDPTDVRELVIAGMDGPRRRARRGPRPRTRGRGDSRVRRGRQCSTCCHAALLTTTADITVVGARDQRRDRVPSRVARRWALGRTRLGSHRPRARTDERRQVETGLPQARRRALWRFGDVAPHWDRLELRSFIEVSGARTPYQDGTACGDAAAAGTLVKDLISRGGAFEPGTAMFCGTLATLSAIRPSPAIRDGAARPRAWPHDPSRVSRARSRPESL